MDKQTINNKETDFDFETCIDDVKKIINMLNNKELNLKEGMLLYKKAKNNLDLANKILENAEFEIKNEMNNTNEDKNERN